MIFDLRRSKTKSALFVLLAILGHRSLQKMKKTEIIIPRPFLNPKLFRHPRSPEYLPQALSRHCAPRDQGGDPSRAGMDAEHTSVSGFPTRSSSTLPQKAPAPPAPRPLRASGTACRGSSHAPSRDSAPASARS